MAITGGCYCKGVRYEADGDAIMKAQCHCRECQYITGGGPNFFMAVPEAGFKITEGDTKGFQRQDIEGAVTREFCPECGTHILTRAPGLPGAVILKVGSLDDPSVFGMPDIAIFTIDQQVFHQLPQGVPAFERVPG